MRRKGLWPVPDAPVFQSVEMDAAQECASAAQPGDGETAEVTIVLRNGRELRCAGGIGDAALARLVRLVETA